jgi:hypothetical protein
VLVPELGHGLLIPFHPSNCKGVVMATDSIARESIVWSRCCNVMHEKAGKLHWLLQILRERSANSASPPNNMRVPRGSPLLGLTSLEEKMIYRGTMS